MSAAVMSNFYFQPFGQGHGTDSDSRVQSWMLAQMAQYPPPPPQPDQQHQYNALYPVSAGAQQVVDPHESLQYSSLNQPVYAKVEAASPATNGHDMSHIAHGLHQQASFDEQGPQPHDAARQHIPQALPVQTSGTPRASQAPTQHSTADQSQKSNRLRKACDSCSIRKVKCDESGPPCRACASLDIPCTFDRPSRRRGPPNRHAEAIKRKRMEEAAIAAAGGSPSMSAVSLSSPSSPTHAARALTALSVPQTSSPNLSAESICPVDIIDRLIDDFFTYIHPLCPFPHEPSFREAWKRREDLSNTSFLALLSSMIAALVASFPRRPRQHLKQSDREHLFSNHMSLINRCQKVCAAARGPGYLESDNLNVYDAATSYFLAVAGAYTFRWRQARLYFGECLTIIRTLGLHKAGDQSPGYVNGRHDSNASYGATSSNANDPGVNCITREIGRRLFWTLFVSIRACSQFGAEFSELHMPPPTPSEPYPPFPMEVDDICIYSSHIEPQPAGLIPEVTGFIANVRVYASYQDINRIEMAWGIDSVVDWDRQRRVLYEALQRCKSAVAELPPPLMVTPNQQTVQGVFPNFSANETNSGTTTYMHLDQTPEQRRQLQCEIQKANIYASCLATRSYIVQKYWNLCEARDRTRSGSRQNSPGTGIVQAGLDGLLPRAPTSEHDHIEEEVKHERESIVRDLLIVLSTIKEVHMEPSADSFTNKVRSIASTLLDAPDERKGQLSNEAREYLGAFLKLLMRLERVSPADSDPDQPEDDEAELRGWADLRDYQMKFAQQGGILGIV